MLNTNHPTLQQALWKKQNGVGLPELMIGIVVGLIILSGTISLYINTIKNSSNTLLSTKLNQELSTAMSLMVSDIRRTGYWANANSGSANPFTVVTSPATNINVLESLSCILYSYDHNSDGINNNEIFGFRHVDSDADGSKDSIQILHGTATSTEDCNLGNWLELVNSHVIKVDVLNFSTTGSKCINSSDIALPQWTVSSTPTANSACSDSGAAGYAAPTTGDVLLESRQITIRLSGHLRQNPSVSKALEETVNIRNDRIVQM
ncbi:MAG: hypothetical protein OEZ68_20855 [Gammaproteobacteria bacterium]|nr:hypothetical protein [Gammaproteobacteria bacterium]MDH5803252.1 hypothetical protein [Gammaproteobacteria bacterium]